MNLRTILRMFVAAAAALVGLVLGPQPVRAARVVDVEVHEVRADDPEHQPLGSYPYQEFFRNPDPLSNGEWDVGWDEYSPQFTSQTPGVTLSIGGSSTPATVVAAPRAGVCALATPVDQSNECHSLMRPSEGTWRVSATVPDDAVEFGLLIQMFAHFREVSGTSHHVMDIAHGNHVQTSADRGVHLVINPVAGTWRIEGDPGDQASPTTADSNAHPQTRMMDQLHNGGISFSVSIGDPLLEPAPGGLRLLTQQQLENTIEHLLGATSSTAASASLPEDPGGTLFKTTAAFRHALSFAEVNQYAAAADAAANAALQDRMAASSVLAQIAPCVAQDNPNAAAREFCYGQVARALGRLIFRVSDLAVQVPALVQIGTLGETEPDSAAGETPFDAGLRYVLATMLQTPSFLYSTEVGVDCSPCVARKLRPFELATRMSLFLLGRGPDKALLDAAELGELDDADSVRDKAGQMLATPEARSAFGAQVVAEMFDLDLLESVGKDATLFPEFDTTLKAAMREEVLRFADKVVFGPDATRPFFHVITSPVREINDLLAEQIYGGVPFAAGPDGWGEVDFSVVAPEQNRAGVLTFPAFLSVHAMANRTSIVGRGKYVTEALLCQQIPPPPPGVDATLDAPQPGTTWREAFEAHQNEDTCAACHAILDPRGFALENFDAIGVFRTSDNGGVVHASGELKVGGLPPELFDNPVQFMDALAGATYAETVANCWLGQVHTIAVGNVPDTKQAPGVMDLQQRINAPQFSMHALLQELTASELFTMVGPPRDAQ